ncbi:hypothetical protein PAAG_05131 [Paracoccidioides lutzii Pb01]|uniref:Uncharacterized protein n=1 Tax=Paracoccidioides lutzii (strain ATCC MYA-826 / Pb01) TaxID=502779 RepID=C1H2Y8_PARBA|nr:hypothetical protein PAAG_05131 [Paracoccidioides lutzii Pb01]EEH34082.2 hypothetical protein PAAG_05131 [Paracoccidioides lutzii Pb01]
MPWRDHLGDVYRHLPGRNVNRFLALHRGYRVNFLHVILNLQFPEVQHENNEPLKCRETVDDIQACNEYLTSRVSELFTAIKILEERELPNHQPTGLCLTIESPFQSDKNDRHCNHRRFHRWSVQLLNPENLPKLFSTVDIFTSVSQIIQSTRLSLTSLDRWEGPWSDSRHAFGEAISSDMVPAKLKTAGLYFCSNIDSHLGWHVDQSAALPDLVSPLSYNLLNSRVFTQRLFGAPGCQVSTRITLWNMIFSRSGRQEFEYTRLQRHARALPSPYRKLFRIIPIDEPRPILRIICKITVQHAVPGEGLSANDIDVTSWARHEREVYQLPYSESVISYIFCLVWNSYFDMAGYRRMEAKRRVKPALS